MNQGKSERSLNPQQKHPMISPSSASLRVHEFFKYRAELHPDRRAAWKVQKGFTQHERRFTYIVLRALLRGEMPKMKNLLHKLLIESNVDVSGISGNEFSIGYLNTLLIGLRRSFGSALSTSQLSTSTNITCHFAALPTLPAKLNKFHFVTFSFCSLSARKRFVSFHC